MSNAIVGVNVFVPRTSAPGGSARLRSRTVPIC
jgi:hypothetical protein